MMVGKNKPNNMIKTGFTKYKIPKSKTKPSEKNLALLVFDSNIRLKQSTKNDDKTSPTKISVF